MVAEQHQLVALRDDADVAHLAAPLDRAHVGLDGVVAEVGAAEERPAALGERERVLGELDQHLAAVEIAHRELAGGVDPVRRRRLAAVLEVERPGQIGDDADARRAATAPRRVALTSPACAPAAAVGGELAVGDRALQVLRASRSPAPASATGVAVRVEGPDRQRDRLARLQDQLGRRDQQRRRRPAAAGAAARPRPAAPAAAAPARPSARSRRVASIDVDVDAAARDGRRRDDLLRTSCGVPSQILSRISRLVGVRPDDVELAALPCSRCRHTACRRRAPARPSAIVPSVSLPQLLAGLDVEREQHAAVVEQVDALAVGHRRRVAGLHAAHDPARVLVGQRALRRRRHRREHAHLAADRCSPRCGVTMTSSPTTSAAVLRPRLLTCQFHTGSPVATFSACIAPSLPPEKNIRDAVDVGDERIGVDGVGRPPFGRADPDASGRWSCRSAMKRCAPPAYWPQTNVRPLTITWSPSMIGDDMRPPCVVHMPNSSASERSHSSLPSVSTATSAGRCR